MPKARAAIQVLLSMRTSSLRVRACLSSLSGSATATTSPLATTCRVRSGKMLVTAASMVTVPGPDSSMVSPGSRPSTVRLSSGPPDRKLRPERTARHQPS